MNNKIVVSGETIVSHDKNVYVLGAGASADGGAPVIKDFLNVARDLYYDEPSVLTDEERKYYSEIFKYRKRIAGVLEKLHADPYDIEYLFGLLDVEYEFGENEKNGKLRKYLTYFIESTLRNTIEKSIKEQRIQTPANMKESIEKSIRSYAPEVRLESITPLIKEAGSSGNVDMYEFFACMVGRYFRFMDSSSINEDNIETDSIITFNYDTIIDNSLTRVGLVPEYYLQNPDDNINRKRHIPLLKLHGSVNWLVCPKCEHVDILPAKSINEFYRDSLCSKCNQDGQKELLMVPPTWNKSYYRIEITQERFSEYSCAFD